MLRPTPILVAFLAFCSGILTNGGAAAAPILFDDRAVWAADFDSVRTSSFEGAVHPDSPDGNGREQQYYGGYDDGRVAMSVDYMLGRELIAATPAVPTDWPLPSTAFVWQGPLWGGPPALDVEFSRPTTAVGFDIGPGGHGPNQIYAQLFGEGITHEFLLDTRIDGFAFWGVHLDMPVDSMRLIVAGVPPGQVTHAAWIDNLSVSAPVPEPTTMVLVGSGLVGMLARARVRRKAGVS